MYIDCETVYSSSSAVKQRSETLRKAINPVPLFYLCRLHPQLSPIVSKWAALVWRKTYFGQTIWPAGNQLTTAFAILNYLEYELLKGFLVQGLQQSFWKFPIFSNILDLQWCLPNQRKNHSQLSAMFTCRDGKGGKPISSQVSNMLYKPPGTVYIASYKVPLDQSDCWKPFVQLWNYTYYL